jgi:hypothetical protein
MDIGDVKRVRARDDPFGHAMGTRNNQVEFLEVEKLDRERKEREIVAIVLAEERFPLKKTRPDDPFLDVGNLASGKMEKRVNRRGRKDLRKDFEDFFPAAAAGKPIMDKGDPSVLHQRDYNLFSAARSR